MIANRPLSKEPRGLFLGALVMELFSSLSGLSDRLLWLILWVLIAATLVLCPRFLGDNCGRIRN